MRIAYVVDHYGYNEPKYLEAFNKYSPSSDSIKVFALLRGGPEVTSHVGVTFFDNDTERLTDSVKSFDPDVIHTFRSTQDKRFNPAILRSGAAPKVETLHFGIWDDHSHLMEAHTFPTRLMLLDLIRRNNVPTDLLDRFIVLPYPVDLAKIAEVDSRRAEKIRCELTPNHELLIGMAAAALPLKKSGGLIKSLGLLKKRMPNFRFVSIGGQPSGFLQRASAAGLSRNIIDVGWLKPDDLYCWIKALDLYTHHAVRGETFGIAIAEAMACGIPVVVNSTPWAVNGQAELVENRINGLVAQSSAGWADSILYLARNPELRSQFSSIGIAKIAKLCNPRTVASNLWKIYYELTSNGGIGDSGILLRDLQSLFALSRENIYDVGPRYLFPRMTTHISSRIEIAGSVIRSIRGLSGI